MGTYLWRKLELFSRFLQNTELNQWVPASSTRKDGDRKKLQAETVTFQDCMDINCSDLLSTVPWNLPLCQKLWRLTLLEHLSKWVLDWSSCFSCLERSLSEGLLLSLCLVEGKSTPNFLPGDKACEKMHQRAAILLPKREICKTLRR